MNESISTKARAFALRLVEALPLSVFLLYMAIANPRLPDEWRAPYFAATAIAVLATWFLVRRGATLSRIYLGIALYFLSGTIAMITRWPWLNEQYGRLEGTAMMFWVLAAGVYFTFFDRQGFIGAEGLAPERVRRASMLLLAITTAATVFSVSFLGNRLLSSFLPFIVVFTAHGIIKARVRVRSPATEPGMPRP
jgi:hypothetical protein